MLKKIIVGSLILILTVGLFIFVTSSLENEPSEPKSDQSNYEPEAESDYIKAIVK